MYLYSSPGICVQRGNGQNFISLNTSIWKWIDPSTHFPAWISYYFFHQGGRLPLDQFGFTMLPIEHILMSLPLLLRRTLCALEYSWLHRERSPLQQPCVVEILHAYFGVILLLMFDWKRCAIKNVKGNRPPSGKKYRVNHKNGKQWPSLKVTNSELSKSEHRLAEAAIERVLKYHTDNQYNRLFQQL